MGLYRSNGALAEQVIKGQEDEMKTFRRILAIVLLTVVVLVVGYLCYTGSRLADTSQEAFYEQTISY